MTDQQREIIIDVASQMFVAEGIKAVRMDDVARRAGISKRTLYETFGDKEELIYLSMDRYFHNLEMDNREKGCNAPNVLIAILIGVKEAIRGSEVNWRLINTLRKFHFTTFKRLNNERAERRRIEFRQSLEIGVQQGVLNPNANLDLAITMLYSIATSVISQDTIDPLPANVTPQQALYEMTIYFLRGIATTKGIESIEEYLKSTKQER